MNKIIDKEIREAVMEVEIAKNQFNFAEKDFIDVACFKLTHAKTRLDTLLKLNKIHGTICHSNIML